MEKTAESIISDSRFFIQIFNIIIENLDSKNINQAFNYLNEIEEFIDKVKRFSPYLYELNLWCKAVIIYYFLVHPYKLSEENKEKLVKDNEEVYKFVLFMDEILDKFYYFKGFLEAKKIVKMNLGEYIFYFEYIQNNDKIIDSLNKDKLKFEIISNNKIMGNILSYLNINESVIFINFNKSLYHSFQQSLDITCKNILKKLLKIK